MISKLEEKLLLFFFFITVTLNILKTRDLCNMQYAKTCLCNYLTITIQVQSRGQMNRIVIHLLLEVNIRLSYEITR